MSQSHTGVPNDTVPDRTVPEDTVPGETCSLGEVLEQVSGKWNIGIIMAAMAGPIRFTELEREVQGISRRMLTLTLRKLERDGLLIRTVHPTVPPKVEYTLTEIAHELHDTFIGLTAWADRHKASIAAARRAYDAQSQGA